MMEKRDILFNEIKMCSRNGNYIKENKDTVTEYEPLGVFVSIIK